MNWVNFKRFKVVDSCFGDRFVDEYSFAFTFVFLACVKVSVLVHTRVLFFFLSSPKEAFGGDVLIFLSFVFLACVKVSVLVHTRVLFFFLSSPKEAFGGDVLIFLGFVLDCVVRLIANQILFVVSW